MKEIKLKSLHLENFMKFRDFTFEPGGKSAVLRGDNKTGKTTNASGFAWLLFDKDVHGNSTGNFSIKTTDENDEIIPNIDHSVTGILDIEGAPLILQKIYREKWLKKRKVLTGHTTEYLIDEVPVLKKEYDAKIAEIIPEETFRLLTDINYFNSDKFGWQNRRKILFQLCEGLSEEALDAAEKAKKILASKKKKINEKKDGIQPRIDEKNRDLAAIADYNQTEIKTRIADLDKQIQDIKTDSTKATLLKEQGELEAKLSQIKAGKEKERQEATSGIRAEIEKIENGYAKGKRTIHDIEFDINWQTDTAGDIEAKIDGLYSEQDKLAAEKPDILDLCPTCSKPFLPEEKEAVRAEFNLQQSKKNEDIVTTGKKARAKLTAATEEKINLEVKLKAEQANLAKIEKDLEKKKTEFENIISPPKISKDEAETIALRGRITEIEALLLQQDQQHDTAALEADLATERTKIAKIDAGEEHKIRIVELGEQEKALSAEIERLESALYKSENEIERIARSVEDEINSKFELCTFKLFDIQLNEGVRPCCKSLIGGIEWGHGSNTGNEMLGGCDIISTLQRHYGILCPVWVDNKESLSSDIKMDCQVISLIMDPKYKKLEIIIDK